MRASISFEQNKLITFGYKLLLCEPMIGNKELNGTGEKLPELGIGTWKMGTNPEKETEAIKTAIKSGMRFVDTAEMYATEWIVAEAIKNQKNVFVATKVSPSHFSYKDIINSCNASLRNLGIKTIDLYQLHWPNHHVPIKETMKAMEYLVDIGKIRYIGVSNFTVNEFMDAQNAMDKYEIVSNQVEYSLLARDIERDMLDFCKENKITVIAYSPLGSGLIYDPKYKKTLEMLKTIGKAHGKSPTQVALNWVISKENVVAIPKGGNKEHILDIAGASGWSLTKSEKNELEAVGEKKRSLAGVFNPILKHTSLWADAAQLFNDKRSKANQKRSTTKSSKK
jgi:diketogulonate reductase-like aldo/keto reductase